MKQFRLGCMLAKEARKTGEALGKSPRRRGTLCRRGTRGGRGSEGAHKIGIVRHGKFHHRLFLTEEIDGSFQVANAAEIVIALFLDAAKEREGLIAFECLFVACCIGGLEFGQTDTQGGFKVVKLVGCPAEGD
jgi:hypothetical protein